MMNKFKDIRDLNNRNSDSITLNNENDLNKSINILKVFSQC